MKRNSCRVLVPALTFALALTLEGSQAGAQSPAANQSTRVASKRAVFSGTINSRLPTLETPGAPKRVYFPPPNTLQFSGTKYCGDGDVAAFHAGAGREIKYFDVGRPANMALGYWVVKKSQIVAGRPPVPTPTTWFTIGYADQMPVDEPPTDELYEANLARSNGKQKAFKLMTDTLKNLSSIAVDKMSYVKTSGEPYVLYMTALACQDFSNREGGPSENGAREDNGATGINVTTQFVTGDKIVKSGSLAISLDGYYTSKLNPSDDSISASDAKQAVDKFFKYDVKSRGVDKSIPGIQLVMDGSQSVDHGIADAVRTHIGNVLDLPKPSVDLKSVPIVACAANSSSGSACTDQVVGQCPCEEYDYEGRMKSTSVYATTERLVSAVDAFKSKDQQCTLKNSIYYSVPLEKTGQFDWESFPTNAACNYGKMEANTATLKTAAVAFFAPSGHQYRCPSSTTSCPSGGFKPPQGVIPDDKDFLKWKKDLALQISKTVVGPAVLRSAEETLAKKIGMGSDKIALNRVSCLPTDHLGSGGGGFNYVRTVGGSMHLPMKLVAGKLRLHDPGTMSHPEGDLAINSATQRRYQGGDGDWRTIFNTGTAPESSYEIIPGGGKTYNIESPGIHLMFNVRAIGCSQNMVCEQPPPMTKDPSL